MMINDYNNTHRSNPFSLALIRWSHQVSDEEWHKAIEEMIQLLEMKSENLLDSSFLYSDSDSDSDSDSISNSNSNLDSDSVPVHSEQMRNLHMAELFPTPPPESIRKKNPSKKRNAELINSLLGLPRIMKVVG